MTGELPPLEITDLLWRHDPVTGVRTPTRRDAVLSRLAPSGQTRAAYIVARLPTDGPYLAVPETDALLLRIHGELQRLAEEFHLGRRVAATLDSRVRALRDEQPELPVRVVDVGCGIGYLIRWLAARQALGADVQLYGVDYGETLIRHATRLADVEGLACEFVSGDALAPGTAIDDGARTIVISSGLLHHLSTAELRDLFAAQQRLGVAAFAHWDLDPSRFATLGAWVFHRARMREAVSRHDGVLSARRAHPAAALLAAARTGAPSYRTNCTDASGRRPNVIDVLRPITGTVRVP